MMNSGDLDRVDDLYVEDYIDHSQGTRGREALKQGFAALRQAFPDVSIRVEDVVVEGDKFAARVSATATHHAEFMGIPATGKPIGISGFWIERVEGGRMAEHWGLLDRLTLLQQLGVMEAPQ